MKDKKWLKITIGLFIIPIMFCVFILDRITLLVLPHVAGTTIQKFLFDKKEMKSSLIRVIAVGICYWLIDLIYYSI